MKDNTRWIKFLLGCLVLTYTENLDKITSLEGRLHLEGNKRKTVLRCKEALSPICCTLQCRLLPGMQSFDLVGPLEFRVGDGE